MKNVKLSGFCSLSYAKDRNLKFLLELVNRGKHFSMNKRAK